MKSDGDAEQWNSWMSKPPPSWGKKERANVYFRPFFRNILLLVLADGTNFEIHRIQWQSFELTTPGHRANILWRRHGLHQFEKTPFSTLPLTSLAHDILHGNSAQASC